MAHDIRKVAKQVMSNEGNPNTWLKNMLEIASRIVKRYDAGHDDVDVKDAIALADGFEHMSSAFVMGEEFPDAWMKNR